MTDPLPVPDLLDADARVRVDAEDLRQTIVFGFASGANVESFERALAEAELPPSDFSPANFGHDLFLDTLVARTLELRIARRGKVREGGERASPYVVLKPCLPYLLRVISEPPRDPRAAAQRQRVLEEVFASPSFRIELEDVYVDLVRLRALFCVGRDAAPRLRRLDVLRATRALVDSLAKAFEGAESALSRLSAFGKAVQDTPAYRRLDALLDHEDHLATVDLRVRVGADGELSAFQIVAVREHTENPFYASPLGRFFARIWLYLRGYRLSSGVVVEGLYEDVFGDLEKPLVMMFQLLGDLEFFLAALALADRAKDVGLGVCFPTWIEDDENAEPGAIGVDYDALWNPLLLSDPTAIDKHAPKPPVPCDLETARATGVTIVTGPNSGGKTRLLQALALAQLFAEAGLFVPASRARLRRASGLFVSLIEDTRPDQTEGQLGMELTRIRRLFEDVQPGSLVLLDELCSGTNPSEGEEIAELVLSLLPNVGARAFVTTHLLKFAARLEAERPIEGLEFFQVQIDADEKPTFEFVPGVARSSLAKRTAARLGVTRDELLALIARKSAKTTEPTKKPRAGANGSTRSARRVT